MTNEEYTKADIQLKREMNSKIKEFTMKVRKEYQEKLYGYNQERINYLNVNGICIGDIISDGEKLMRVKNIFYCHSEFKNNSFLEFSGELLTKTLKPKVDQDGNFIQQRYGYVPTIIKKKEA